MVIGSFHYGRTKWYFLDWKKERESRVKLVWPITQLKGNDAEFCWVFFHQECLSAYVENRIAISKEWTYGTVLCKPQTKLVLFSGLKYSTSSEKDYWFITCHSVSFGILFKVWTEFVLQECFSVAQKFSMALATFICHLEVAKWNQWVVLLNVV